MRPTKQLPHDYYEHANLDLSKNRWAAIGINIAALPLLFAWGWLFVQLARWLNPGFAIAIQLDSFVVSISHLLLVIITIFGVILLHELVHGLFLWVFTRERPHFGYNWYYAYAGAPDWYLPRWPYIMVALAPLVVISLLGVVFLPFIESPVMILLLMALITNATGAVGDLYVTIWVLLQPSTILVRDMGPAFFLYRQKNNKPV